MPTCEDVSISLQILMVGMWRSCSRLTIVVCAVPLIPMVMMMERSIVHPSNDCRVANFVRFLAVASMGKMPLQ